MAARRRSRSGSSTSMSRRRGDERGDEFSFPGDRDAIRTRADRRGAPPRAAPPDTKSARRRMTPAASVGDGDRLRLFLALQLPSETLDCVADWQARHLERRSARAARAPARHARLPRRRPAPSSPAIVDGPPARVDGAGELPLAPVRLARDAERGDGRASTISPAGATALAEALHARLDALGVYRRGGAPVAAAPHRAALSRAPAAPARRSRRREHSFRPVLLLIYLVCTRPAPGTRCSIASR